MQLTPFCLMLSCLQVQPDRSQFFRYDTITLTCEDRLNSTGWRVKRKTPGGGTRPCSYGWGSASWGSTCIIGATYPTDSGVYWCESADGEQSTAVNITITDRTVILESPAMPVSEGVAVTLHCKAEMNSTDHFFSFYKDGVHISNSLEGELTIHSASKSDEGLYTCSISGGAESMSSWLAIDAPFVTSNFTSAAPRSLCLNSTFRRIFYLVMGTLYLISTILLVLVYRHRKKDQKISERRGNSNVVMEVAV